MKKIFQKYKDKNRLVKTIFLGFCFLLLFSAYSAAQNQKELNNAGENWIQQVVMVELYSQENCSTCPKAAFCLEDIAWEYGTEKVILLEQHLWGDGYDTPETNNRYDWYTGDSKKATPDVFINGMSTRIQGLGCDNIEKNYNNYRQLIDKELEKITPIKIDGSKTFSGKRIRVFGSIQNKGDQPIKDIFFCGMIYEEGEDTGKLYLVRDIFPPFEIKLLYPGEKIELQLESERILDDSIKQEYYHAVMFIQEKDSKNVLQAIYIP
jgi:hypothetical protein